MSLDKLKPFFNEDELDDNINHEQLKLLHDYFIEEFVNKPFEVNGKKIKIDQSPAKGEFKAYCATFYHIVTKKILFAGKRLYESKRANRIHWIKEILLSHPSSDIKYFKWRDDDGVCKEHFWCIHEHFMIVLVEIAPNFQVVTAFCVDDDEVTRGKYYERYADFRDGNCDCP